jgi:hypothetical protein
MRFTASSPLIHEKPEFHRVFMRWVVTTDTNGNRRPQMRWRAN